MSLINDALKKAQRQRTEGSTPATEVSTPGDTQEPLQRVARRAKPVGFRSQLILIGGGAAAAVLLLGVGAFFLFRPAAEPAKVSSAPAGTTAAPTPAVVSVAPAAPIAAAPAVPIQTPVGPPAPVQVVAAPVAPAPTPVAVETPAPAATATAPVSFSIPTPAATASTPAVTPVATPASAAPAATERPKASTRMIGVIEHMKVGGIRVAGAESKVLMNDRVYRINDIVDFELGIRLTAIEAKALTFEDGRGAVHVRTF